MKNGMQMLLESLLPPETLQQIQAAANAIPTFAKSIQAQLNRMEETISHIEMVVERIENKVLANEPPERTPLSDFAMTAIAEGEYQNGAAILRHVLTSEGTGDFPETLRKELKKDGR